MQNIWQFCIVMIPQAFGLSMQNVVISSVLTKRVSQADTGNWIEIIVKKDLIKGLIILHNPFKYKK